jgi:hypothetical protein
MFLLFYVAIVQKPLTGPKSSYTNWIHTDVCRETTVVIARGKIDFSERLELTYDSKYKSED